MSARVFDRKEIRSRVSGEMGRYFLVFLVQPAKRISHFDIGGDEFVLIMPATSKEKAARTANLIIKTIDDFLAQEVKLMDKSISVSIRISLAPEDGEDQDSLYKKADLALYQSKQRGKQQYHFYTE